MSRAATRRRRRLHWWNRGSGIRLRVWMAVNMIVLSSLSAGVYMLVTTHTQDTGYTGLGKKGSGPGLLDRLKGESAPGIPTKQQVMDPKGLYFGAATENAPYDAAELDRFSAQTGGIRPAMASYFLAWNKKFNPYSVTAAYDHGTLPVLTWEPWAGGQQNPQGGEILKSNTEQPKYRLANITAGRFDPYITRTAKAIADTRRPLVIRFAHEMNGIWYPWCEGVNGNHKGDFAKAYRHIHDVFEKAGADNVIWVWAPNIIRPEPGIKLKPLYPGDAYVDWIGVTGYGVHERTPEITFGPTFEEMRTFTRKPLLIMETGAQIDEQQLNWVRAFFPWLEKQPGLIGFIWMEKDRKTGSRADWRFTSSPRLQQAFQKGLATLDLASGNPAENTTAGDGS